MTLLPEVNKANNHRLLPVVFSARQESRSPKKRLLPGEKLARIFDF